MVRLVRLNVSPVTWKAMVKRWRPRSCVSPAWLDSCKRVKLDDTGWWATRIVSDIDWKMSLNNSPYIPDFLSNEISKSHRKKGQVGPTEGLHWTRSCGDGNKHILVQWFMVWANAWLTPWTVHLDFNLPALWPEIHRNWLAICVFRSKAYMPDIIWHHTCVCVYICLKIHH